MSQPPHVDYTRLSDSDLHGLWKELDRTASLRPNNRREHERHEYHIRNVPVTVVHEAGGEAKFLVHARNISCGGMAFLHGGFLHKGATCRVVLPTNDGNSKLVMGRIVACRHVLRNVHEVSVQFHDKIDVERFCGPPRTAAASVACSVTIPALSGLALCASPDESVRAAVVGWLRETGLDVIETQATGPTLDKLKRLPFVLCVIDDAISEANLAALVRAVRGAGFAKSLVMLSSGEAQAGSADGLLTKPVKQAELFDLLTQLSGAENLTDTRPIHSTLTRDPGATTLLEGYIVQAQAAATQLERALESNDLRAAEQACNSLRSTAGGYGFAELGRVAAQASAALDAARSLRQAERQVALLISFCRRLTAERPPTQAPASKSAA